MWNNPQDETRAVNHSPAASLWLEETRKMLRYVSKGSILKDHVYDTTYEYWAISNCTIHLSTNKETSIINTSNNTLAWILLIFWVSQDLKDTHTQYFIKWYLQKIHKQSRLRDPWGNFLQLRYYLFPVLTFTSSKMHCSFDPMHYLPPHNQFKLF